LITLLHLSVSDLIYAANCCGVPAGATMPYQFMVRKNGVSSS
jgi:hypothetical protein